MQRRIRIIQLQRQIEQLKKIKCDRSARAREVELKKLLKDGTD